MRFFIAQNVATSVLFGVSRETIRSHGAEFVTPLDSIAAIIMAWIADRDTGTCHRESVETETDEPRPIAQVRFVRSCNLLTRAMLPQYESELTTSPALIEPSATQVFGLIEFLMKWTEPSPKSVLTPPGCRLREAT